jgi:hypothetical protein
MASEHDGIEIGVPAPGDRFAQPFNNCAILNFSLAQNIGQSNVEMSSYRISEQPATSSELRLVCP